MNMSIQKVQTDLDLLRPARWAEAGIKALSQANMKYEGTTSPGTTLATELHRIYNARLLHCRKVGIDAVGLAELVDWLGSSPPENLISVEPFLSPTTAVVVFYSPGGVLGACVTVTVDPASGKEAFARAMTQ